MRQAALAALLCASFFIASDARACLLCEPIIEATENVNVPITEQFITTQRELTEQWVMEDVWNAYLEPGLQQFADQMSATAMQQVLAVGMFLDAKHQLESQRILQTIRARAHKDYQPSAGMCEFGSSVKSLAASERKAELTAHALSQRSQDRNMRNANTSSASAANGDQTNRLQNYCTSNRNSFDNNGGTPCAGAAAVPNPQRMNIDIDYTSAIEMPWTLNVDFTDTNLTEAETDLFSLANNLYGFDIFKTVTQFNDAGAASGELNPAQSQYLDSRAMIAKRSVAENSFNAITSMKTAGTAGSRDYLEAILRDLGVSPTPAAGGAAGTDDISRLLGTDVNGNEIAPSYYAQMEVLTKKIYQNPSFYTNLYDKPANVERKEVAMQAIGLMQKFDMYKSFLRSEAALSVILETALEEGGQSKSQDKLSGQSTE